MIYVKSRLNIKNNRHIYCINMLSNKIRGTFYGLLIGDCVGALFEETSILSKGSCLLLKNFWDNLGSRSIVPRVPYTENTTLSLALAQTLIHQSAKQIDQEVLAKNYVNDYHKNIHRKYSDNYRRIFESLKASNYENILKPAQNAMNETDNGCAAYIAPLALYCFIQKNLTIENIVPAAVAITHTHQISIDGAILQAAAIVQLLKNTNDLNKNEFLKNLAEQIAHQNTMAEDTASYHRQLEHIKNLLNLNSVSEERIVNLLGHSTHGIYSVPTAIYCFLRCLNQDNESNALQPQESFRNAVEYAVKLGGNSSTIASMTGALCGAYFGDSIITEKIGKQFEGFETVDEISQKYVKAI